MIARIIKAEVCVKNFKKMFQLQVEPYFHCHHYNNFS